MVLGMAKGKLLHFLHGLGQIIPDSLGLIFLPVQLEGLRLHVLLRPFY